ncbi:SapC family protein [Ruegeria sp. Ofav3-42]|uniref:SapC family protein n=1 Tax=Ruegeria sp. Ofav3-42 TaxID=2917759 RepID=UPI001EF49906|nr:SapC family protein [Ruegeria sp. Ofav3-42]MCG7522194.1 SapC family protein [Ruegeria sp. Ofav3-42]
MAQNGLFPVTYARHRDRYWKRLSSFHFVKGRSECPIVEKEVLPVAAAYPILFRKIETGVEPVAVLSLIPDAPTPFVAQDGRWLAGYIPSDLRCPPFQAGLSEQQADAEQGRLQLMVDETLGLVTDVPGDEPFFTADGKLTAELLRVRTFLQARAASAQQTQSMCSVLEELKILEPMKSYEGVSLPAGYLGVAAGRSNALSQAEKLTLFEFGAIRMIHAHQVSLSHLTWLSRAHEQSDRPEKSKHYTKNSDISRFLSAMAHAQQEELLEVGEV